MISNDRIINLIKRGRKSLWLIPDAIPDFAWTALRKVKKSLVFYDTALESGNSYNDKLMQTRPWISMTGTW